jgi:hypothetical protein
MNGFLDKANMVTILRGAAMFLFLLFIVQAFVNAGHGAGAVNKALIFVSTIANGLFQPLVLLGVAELIRIKKA